MTDRLSSAALGALPKAIKTPRYDRAACKPGIVHLGLGAFHRAHQAVFVDDCLNAGENDWGIVGASLRSADTRDALGPQDGLYTLSVVDGSGEKLRVIESILSSLVAPENPGALLDALTEPGIKIVTLTVTEKAYLRDAVGGLDERHPDIVWDLQNPSRPRTVHGFLTEAIARRRAAGTDAFTILSCDNLPANGATLKRLLVAFAKMRDPELGRFVEEEIAFPSSMVDRIVPATTDEDRARISKALGVADAWPITTEPFLQWVIEDHFPNGRPDWERFGVEMVKDVEPFEDMKLRLLNGAHSSIAYLGLLMGHATVSEAFSDPLIRKFVARLWAEAIPSLPEGVGLKPEAYTAELTKRFDNPALRHRTAQIGNDGSQKLPQRIVATAMERVKAGGSARHLMLTPAAWIAACEARGQALPPGHFTDPLDGALTDIFAMGLNAGQMVREVFDAAGFAVGSPHRDELMGLASTHLDSLRRFGAATTLEELLR
ncbi:MAG: mannitol dehydrogenase family protein [Rhizobiaceae bacterium]